MRYYVAVLLFPLVFVSCAGEVQFSSRPSQPITSTSLSQSEIDFKDNYESIPETSSVILSNGQSISLDEIHRTVTAQRLGRGAWLDQIDITYSVDRENIEPKSLSRRILRTHSIALGAMPTGPTQEFLNGTPLNYREGQIFVEKRSLGAFRLDLNLRFPLSDDQPSLQVSLGEIQFDANCGILRIDQRLSPSVEVSDRVKGLITTQFDTSGLDAGKIYRLRFEGIRTPLTDTEIRVDRFFAFVPGDINSDSIVDDQDLQEFDQFANAIINDYEINNVFYIDLLRIVDLNGDFPEIVAPNRQFLVDQISAASSRQSGIQCFDHMNRSLNTSTDVSHAISLEAQSVASLPSLRAIDGEGHRPVKERDSVLVAYNQNDPDGLEIAQHYQTRRNLSPQQICGLKLPAGDFASLDQLFEARDQIHDCICRLIPQVSNCANLTPQALAEVSPISHLVLMGMIPIRILNSGWSALTPDNNFTVTVDQQMPVFGFHLAAALYTNLISNPSYDGSSIRPFSYENLKPLNFSYQTTGDRRDLRLPKLTPTMALAVGAIRAASKERTKGLIDQFITEENRGLSGNIMTGLPLRYSGDNRAEVVRSPNSLPGWFIETLGQNVDDCTSYLGQLDESWDYLTCRLGVDLQGRIPGEVGSDIEYPLNVSMYLGVEFENNSHASFENLDALLKWRVTDQSCVTRCQDFPNPADAQVCRNRSKDIYQEFNTDCVGVNPSLLAWQYRSWPVQYHGTFVNGWEGAEYGFGAKTPPRWFAVGGAPSDSNNTGFIRFGSPTANELGTCQNAAGQNYSCASLVPVNFFRRIMLPSNLRIEAGDKIELAAQHRKWISGSTYNFGASFISAGNRALANVNFNPDLNSPNGVWALRDKQFVIPPEAVGSVAIDVYINASIYSNILGMIDFDEIEVNFIKQSGEIHPLLVGHQGDFGRVITEKTNAGDWAGMVVDRMGGLGAWGSANHHATGGHAFSKVEDFAYSFYSGRTLGESLIQAGGQQSGLVFADPAYRPFGVKVSLEREMEFLGPQKQFNALSLERNEELMITAFNGYGSEQNWAFEVCAAFDDQGKCARWKKLVEGSGPVDNLRSGIYLKDLVIDDRITQWIYIRVSVARNGDPSSRIFDYASISYAASR